MSQASLVFLHGWGLHGGIWAGVVDALSARHRVLTPDLPGYGGEPLVAPYSAETVADALAARLAEDSVVCGWSMGGMVAQALAARHPERVRALVLVGTTPVFVKRNDWAHGLEAEVLADFAAGLTADYRATLQRFLSLQARGGDAARAVIARLRQDVFARGEPDPTVLAAGLELLRTVDLRALAAQIEAPTLVVHGAHDTLCPSEAGAWLASEIPNARLALQPRAAHAPFLSHPDWFLGALKDFLADHV